MYRKSLRNFLCAAAAVAFGAFGTAAQAIHYDVGFDPMLFGGVITIDVSPTCLVPFPHDNACGFDVDSVDFFDALNREWIISGPQTGIGDFVRLDANDKLIGIAVDIFNLQPVGFDSNCGEGTHLGFSLDGGEHALGSVFFNCGGHPEASGDGSVTFITQAPEPASLALLGIGIGGLAWARRRRRN